MAATFTVRQVLWLSSLAVLVWPRASLALLRDPGSASWAPQPKLSVVDWNSWDERENDGPGTYSFGYDVEDAASGNTQFRQEERFANGTVAGSYGLLEPDGNVRIVSYVADAAGYRVRIENSLRPDEDFPRRPSSVPRRRPDARPASPVARGDAPDLQVQKNTSDESEWLSSKSQALLPPSTAMAAALGALQAGGRAAGQEQRRRPASAASAASAGERRQPARRGGSARRASQRKQRRQKQQHQAEMQPREMKESRREMDGELKQQMEQQQWQMQFPMQQQRQFQEETTSNNAQGYFSSDNKNGQSEEQKQDAGAKDLNTNDLNRPDNDRQDYGPDADTEKYDVHWSSKPIVVWAAAVPQYQRYQLPPIPLLDDLIYQKNRN